MKSIILLTMLALCGCERKEEGWDTLCGYRIEHVAGAESPVIVR
jgi:hypothetical protein